MPRSRSFGSSALNFFGGTGSQVTVTNAAALQGLAALTLECWVFPRSFPSYATQIRIIQYTGAANTGYSINLHQTGNAGTQPGSVFALLGNGAGAATVNDVRPLLLNQWSHLAIVWDGSTLKLYVNGQLVDTQPCVGVTTGNPAANLVIGNASNVRSFDGYICEARVSNVVRYAANFTPLMQQFVTDVNTVALWHLDSIPTSQTAADSSANALPAVLGGVPAPQLASSVGPFSGGQRFLSGAPTVLGFRSSSATAMTVTNNAAYQGLTALTVECWVYLNSSPSSYGSGARILDYFNVAPNGGFVLNMFTPGSAALSGQVRANGTFATVASPVLSLRQWHHVAMTWDRNTVRLFVDGFLVSSAALVGGDTGNPTVNMTVGNVGVIRAFDGYIYGMHVNNTCLYTSNFTPVVAPPFAQAGTVGLWRMDEGYGTAAADYSVTANNGVISGPTIWLPSGGPFGQQLGRNALASSAFQFYKNSNQQWNVTNNAVFQGLTAMTIEAWVKAYSIPNYSSSARVVQYIGGNAGFSLNQNINVSSGGFGGMFGTVGNGASLVSAGGGPMTLNRWHHIALSWDGLVARFFMDGAWVGSTALVGGNTGNPAVNLLFGTSNQVRSFDGAIAEIRLSKVARYLGTFIPQLFPFVADANTVGLWHCDEASGAVLTDVSGNALTATYSVATPRAVDWVGGPFAIAGALP